MENIWSGLEETRFTEEKPDEGNKETCRVEQVPKEVSVSAGSWGEGGSCKHRDPKEETLLECVRSNRCLCGQGRVSEEPERPRQQCGMGAQDGGRAVVRSVSQEPPYVSMGNRAQTRKLSDEGPSDNENLPLCVQNLIFLRFNKFPSCPCCSCHPVRQPFTIPLILL